MEKINNFLNKNGMLIVIVLLTLTFFQTCGSSETKLKKEIIRLEEKVDSLSVKTVTKTDLEVEGLKAEKRMIQSTDRKMMDVNRQAEIDKKLEKLTNSNN